MALAKGPSKSLSFFFLYIFDSFIETKFTYHAIGPFKVYNSVVLSTFTELCNNPHNQFYISSPKKKLWGSWLAKHVTL